jgi:hypothetical protein
MATNMTFPARRGTARRESADTVYLRSCPSAFAMQEPGLSPRESEQTVLGLESGASSPRRSSYNSSDSGASDRPAGQQKSIQFGRRRSDTAGDSAAPAVVSQHLAVPKQVQRRRATLNGAMTQRRKSLPVDIYGTISRATVLALTHSLTGEPNSRNSDCRISTRRRERAPPTTVQVPSRQSPAVARSARLDRRSHSPARSIDSTTHQVMTGQTDWHFLFRFLDKTPCPFPTGCFRAASPSPTPTKTASNAQVRAQESERQSTRTVVR